MSERLSAEKSVLISSAKRLDCTGRKLHGRGGYSYLRVAVARHTPSWDAPLAMLTMLQHKRFEHWAHKAKLQTAQPYEFTAPQKLQLNVNPEKRKRN